MLIRILFISLFVFLHAKNNNWFITNLEYGKMLYNNPRGISCEKCHGTKGKGKIITSYINSKGKKIKIKTKPIQKLSFTKLKKALFHQINVKKILHKNPDSPIRFINIMPKYDYMTDDEIKALLLYLKSKD